MPPPSNHEPSEPDPAARKTTPAHDPAFAGLSSEALVRRAQRHDAVATAELYARYRDRLRSGLRRLLGSRYRSALLDSEDAVHDGILAALGSLDRFEYRGEGSFLAWLLRVAESEVLQRLRAQRTQRRDVEREQPMDAEAPPAARDPSPSAHAQAAETEQRVRAGLDALSPREREVITLRRYLQLSHEEIRTELGLPSAGAARALLSRAQARLAALLDEGPPGLAR